MSVERQCPHLCFYTLSARTSFSYYFVLKASTSLELRQEFALSSMAEPVENLPSQPDDLPPLTDVDESGRQEEHENPEYQATTDYESALHLPFRIDYAEKLTIESRHTTDAGDRRTCFVIHQPGRVDFQPQVRSRPRRQPAQSDYPPDGFSFTSGGIEIASTVHRQIYVESRRVSPCMTLKFDVR